MGAAAEGASGVANGLRSAASKLIAGAVGGNHGSAVSPEEAYTQRRQEWWAEEKKPCQDPYDCHFHDAFGLPRGLKITKNDVEKHARFASRWWHPDRQGTTEAFQHFEEIRKVLTDSSLRKRYANHVEIELEVAKGEGEEMKWRSVNIRFLKGGEVRERTVRADGKGFWPGTRVRIVGLQASPELNGQLGSCKKWLGESGRWQVRLDGHDTDKSLKPENLRLASASYGGAGSGPSADMNPEQMGLLHIFLDASGSMNNHGRISKAKHIVSDLWPQFVLTPTDIHFIGSRAKCGNSIVSHRFFGRERDLEDQKEVLMRAWKTNGGTFLWQYVYESIKDFGGCRHEAIIVTDGVDELSDGPFKGLQGFNELMKRMQGETIRISLMLIGNSLPQGDAQAYRDLCLATGGVFHHQPERASDQTDEALHALAVQDFVCPLLLPDGERDDLAKVQRMEYERMLEDGAATHFDWYLPLATTQAVSRSSGSNEASQQTEAPRVFRPAPRVSVTEVKCK